MPKDNEVDEKVMPEPLTYGMRRKGETAVIGLIPPKVHANPPKVPEYLRDYEEVPLYSAATVAELRAEVAEQSARAEKWKALHDAVSLAHEVQAKSLTRALDRADAAERRVGECLKLADVLDFISRSPDVTIPQWHRLAGIADEFRDALTGADPT